MFHMDTSLVIFTVLTQLVVGGLVFLTIIDKKYGEKGNQNFIAAGKLTAFSFVFILGVALLVSLFHLGKPFNAYRALNHLSSSWLSREILAFSILFVVLLIYAYLWMKEGSFSNRKNFGLLGSLVGLVGVYFTGMIYTLPASPAWDNAASIMFFFLTCFVLGPLLVASIFSKKGFYKEIKFLSTVALVAIGISVIVFVLYTSILSTSVVEAKLTIKNIIEGKAIWARVILGWLLPIILLFYTSKKKESFSNTILAAFIFGIMGEFIARNIFYTSVVMMQVGQL